MQQNVYMHNIPELAVKKKKNDNIGNLKINLNSLLIRFLFRFSAHTHLQAIYRDQVHVLCFICQMPPSCSSSPVWRAAIKVNGWQNKVHKKVFFQTKKTSHHTWMHAFELCWLNKNFWYYCEVTSFKLFQGNHNFLQMMISAKEIPRVSRFISGWNEQKKKTAKRNLCLLIETSPQLMFCCRKKMRQGMLRILS